MNSLLSSSSSGQTWSRVRGVRRPEGKRGGGNHGGGGVACNVIPVNHTYINICTIKSILVNNTAEDANTNKQTHSKTKTFVLVHFDMQAPGPNPVDPQTKLKSYKRKEKNIKGRDKGFFCLFFFASNPLLCSGWEKRLGRSTTYCLLSFSSYLCS